MFSSQIKSLVSMRSHIIPQTVVHYIGRLQNATRPISTTFLNNFSENGKEIKDTNSKFISEHNNLNDTTYFSSLEKNAQMRKKTHADVCNIKRLWKQINSRNADNLDNLIKELQKELLQLPNTTHSQCKDLLKPVVTQEIGKKKEIKNALPLEKLSHHGIDILDTGNFTGHRSYYLRGSMAQLEHQLIRYAIQELQMEGFKLMSVPDLVSEDVLSGCGTPVDRDCPMVYRLEQMHEGGRVCLSGTAEMALAGWLRGRRLRLADMPLKLCAVSRCHRQEANSNSKQHGIFRVHNFTKVEMFGVTANETGHESEDLYNELVELQKRLLVQLGLHGQVVLMPPEELGNPAHSKTDLEVWLPGRGFYGELTSASNCTDYQAKRLSISYTNDQGKSRFVHTVNGTAIAVPRCIIALCETHQEEEGRRAIRLPRVLGVTPLPGRQRDDTDEAQQKANTAHDPLLCEGDESLDKIMTFGEQCSRGLLTGRKLQIDE